MLAEAALGKLTALVFEKPGKKKFSERNLVKRV